MNLNDIVSIITTVGFPIASWLILAWYIYKVQGETTKAIQNNTKALLILCDKLDVEPSEVLDHD